MRKAKPMKESLQMAMTIATMPAEDQNEFYKALETTGLFTKKEIDSNHGRILKTSEIPENG